MNPFKTGRRFLTGRSNPSSYFVAYAAVLFLSALYYYSLPANHFYQSSAQLEPRFSTLQQLLKASILEDLKITKAKKIVLDHFLRSLPDQKRSAIKQSIPRDLRIGRMDLSSSVVSFELLFHQEVPQMLAGFEVKGLLPVTRWISFYIEDDSVDRALNRKRSRRTLERSIWLQKGDRLEPWMANIFPPIQRLDGVYRPTIWLSEATLETAQDISTQLQGYPAKKSEHFARMLYLSVATITTLGYGDLVPLSSEARMAIGFESLIGVYLFGLFIFSSTSRSSLGAD